MARPTKKYDDSLASEIEAMRGRGVAISDIAKIIGMSEKPLRRIYGKQLEKGKSQANAAITGKLYELCMNGNVTALIFWAKTQLGWREKQAEQETDIEALRAGIKSAFDSVGNGGQAYGVLVTPGIMSEEQWQKEADQYMQGMQEK